MNRLFLILLVLCSLSSRAATYYFAANGLSTNNGTSQSTPYNIGTFNGKTFAAGDFALFRRGDIFNLTTTLSNGSSGTSSAHITMDAYGTGDNPQFTSLAPVTSWTAVSGSPGVYKSTNTFSPQSTVRVVTLDNNTAVKGRYPNADASNGGWLMYDAHSSGSITDNQMDTTPITASWAAGAEVVIRSSNFTIDKGAINSINVTTKTITYSTSTFSSNPSANGYGYIIIGCIQTLDQYGEWFYNINDNRLYMYFGNTNPDFHTVKVATLTTLANIANNYYDIKHLDFIGANMYCFLNNILGKTDIKFTACNFVYAGSYTICMNGRANFTLDSSRVAEGITGINIGYRNDNATISNTTIENCGNILSNIFVDLTFQHRAQYGIFAASATGRGAHIIRCRVLNTGYSGIVAQDEDNILVYKNYINTTNILIDDGAGIYTDNYHNGTVQKNNVIRGNIVLNVKNAPFGKPSNTGVGGSGIYLDDNTSHCTVDSNFIWSAGLFGIFLHNGDSNIIKNNVVIGGGQAQLGFQDDGIGGLISHDTVTNNVFFSFTASQRSYYMASANDGGHNGNDLSLFGVFTNNKLCNPFNESGTIASYNRFGGATSNYTFSSWQSLTGYDGSSGQTGFTIAKPQHIMILYTEQGDRNFPVFGTWKKMGNTTANSLIGGINVIPVKDHSGIVVGQ